MPITMQPCPKASSNVKEIGHCPVENVLAIRFANGGLYHYKNVPADIFHDMQSAESIGAFIAKNVRGQFEHEKILEKPAPSNDQT